MARKLTAKQRAALAKGRRIMSKRRAAKRRGRYRAR